MLNYMDFSYFIHDLFRISPFIITIVYIYNIYVVVSKEVQNYLLQDSFADFDFGHF